MVYDNQTDGCLAGQNGRAKNLRTRWSHQGPGAPPHVQRKQLTPGQTTPTPGTPPAPPGDNDGAQSSQIANLPAGYGYTPTHLSSAQLFIHDASTEDSEHDDDLIPDLWTDEGTYTG